MASASQSQIESALAFIYFCLGNFLFKKETKNNTAFEMFDACAHLPNNSNRTESLGVQIVA